jgi:hypothetical protein
LQYSFFPVAIPIPFLSVLIHYTLELLHVLPPRSRESNFTVIFALNQRDDPSHCAAFFERSSAVNNS